MKELFYKIGRGIFYFFGVMFIITSLTTISDGWNILLILLSVWFWAMILPVVYKKITSLIRDKFPKLWGAKLITSYILIVFIWYMTTLSSVMTGIDTEKELTIEKQQNEAITKLNVEYSINEPVTTNKELRIDIKQENLDKITINWNEISFSWSSFSYPYHLELWKNEIQIQWFNQEIERNSNKTIERITVEEEQNRKELAEEEARKKEEIAKKQKESQKQAEVDKAKEEINNFIAVVEGHKEISYEASTVRWLEMEALLFWSYAVTVEKYRDSEYPEVKNLALDLEKKVSSLQSKQFPKMRKAYVGLVDKTMWEYNIDVYSKWSYNWTIEFVWGYFASNKNKLDTYSTLSEMLRLLRFDRANFKWYEYDDEYTYWTIDSLTDTKVSSWK